MKGGGGGVPRGERPLAGGDDVVVRFAGDLRLLREKAGTPTYRDLGARAHYSAAALSEAASGRKLPSLAVTLAYVAACGGDTAEWEARWRTITAEMAGAAPAEEPAGREDARPPYVGLAAFQREDAGRFFGRSRLVTELVDRVARQRFVGVFGASGCGKSSLLRAGLVARVSADREQEGGAPVVVFTPGQHPLEECAIHLARFLDVSPGTLREELRSDPRNLHLRIRQAAASWVDGSDLVVVVDQFEELFTLCGDERERAGFIDALVTAATDPASRTRVVLGVRADFLGHCGQHPDLVTGLRDGQMLVGAMTTDELRSAITGPAEQAGFRVETGLVARLIADAGHQPGMLPLVSHALLQTWRRRQGTLMTAAGYDAVGGMEHALARTADHLYQSLPAEQRQVAQQVFLRLTALGEGTEDTRRRISRNELAPEDPAEDTAVSTAVVSAVLDALTRARLITVGDHGVEIVHEALIRHWPRLREWLTSDRDGLRLHRQLTEATAVWERDDRDEHLLYRGPRLDAWHNRPLEQLNHAENAFLTASRHAERREHRSRRRRIRWTIGGLSAATVIITVLALIAWGMATRANDERAIAVSRLLVADARAQLQVDPELALLLAREAYTRTPNSDTEAVLRQAFSDSRVRATLTLDGPSDLPFTGGAPVHGVAFTSDGKYLGATAGGKLRVWGWVGDHIADTTPRDLLDDAFSDGPTFSPDGHDLAGVDGAKVVIVRNWSSSYDRMFLPLDNDDQLKTVTFSPTGFHVASSASTGAIYISNATGDNNQLSVLRGHSGDVFGLSFSQDGRLLASGGVDGTIRLWDLAGGGHPRVLRGHAGWVNGVAFSPDGRHVVSAGADGTVRLWDVNGTADPVLLGRHSGGVISVAYSLDGRRIASGGMDDTVRVWNTDRLGLPMVLRGHRGSISEVAFSPDGNHVASGSWDDTVKIWDVTEADDMTVLRGHRGPVSSVAASADGRYVVSGGQDGNVLLWDTTSNRDPLTLHTHNLPVTQVAISADGQRLLSIDADGPGLFVWDTDDPTRSVQLQQLELPSPRFRMALNADGGRLVTTTDLRVQTWNTSPTGIGAPRPLPGPANRDVVISRPFAAMDLSPAGHHIAASLRDGPVLLWDTRTGDRATVMPGHFGLNQSLAFHPDGTLLATGGDDKTITLWDITEPEQPVKTTGHQGSVRTMAFSHDGRNLLISGNDTVQIWPIDTTGTPLVLNGLSTPTRDTATLPDNRYLTGHDDGTIRTWRCHACDPITDLLTQTNHHLTRQLTPQERRTYLPTNP